MAWLDSSLRVIFVQKLPKKLYPFLPNQSAWFFIFQWAGIAFEGGMES
jgi:hypothetical protein